MSPNDFARPRKGFPFEFGGMKLNSRPDSLPPNKFALAINVRAFGGTSIIARPGTTQLFSFPASIYPTDIRAYTTLGTDNLPRILARGANDQIYLDNGASVGTLNSVGLSGASMIPFRPNESPNPYMYIANGGDYRKFSAPDSMNNVVAQKVGIAEPQSPPEASINIFQMYQNTANFAYTLAGTAGTATSGSRVSDTVGAVFADPSSSLRFSLQVSTGKSYQPLMPIVIQSVLNPPTIITDVIAPYTTGKPIGAPYYFTGTTGRCVFLLTMGTGPGVVGTSIYTPNLLSALRRGAIIQFSGGGAEKCMVLSVTTGPDGTLAVETSTIATHVGGETITILPTIIIQQSSSYAIAIGNTLSATFVGATITAGIGTMTSSVPSIFTSGIFPWRSDDYVAFGIRVDNLANLNELKLLFDVDDGSFTKNFYYYTVRPSDIAAAVANASTQISSIQTIDQRAIIDAEVANATNNQLVATTSAQLDPGSAQWCEIIFPISALTRVGSDDTKSLITLQDFQVLINASGTVVLQVEGFGPAAFGTQNPDVGDVGAPYQYRVRPRSSVTGVVGNPSPATRYGVSPRRQNVNVHLPSAAYDSQIDTWDIFRYGGSVTSWRFVGSTPIFNTDFTDNYSDDAVLAGDELDFDNFEPWPSIDLPNNGSIVTSAGFIRIVTSPSSNIASYLPGTLVTLDGNQAFTLRTRPVLISGSNYRLEFVENPGTVGFSTYQIQEPIIARQFLPYMWGPDANGTIFAVGDSLRPGTLYFAKNNNPDSAPDQYNIEITSPSEPLLGGEVLDGLSFVGSSTRWWALYPTPDNPAQRYNVVQQPFPRGLAAPFGHCNDGVSIYWWAKDGIYSTSKGSLTDEDLYGLFPREGAAGRDVTYNGVTIKAPAYQAAGAFRLTYSNGFLYAIYQDSSGNNHCLTLDLHRMAWTYDTYTFPLSCAYAVEQQPESFTTPNPILLFGHRPPTVFQVGFVSKQADLSNDVGLNFSCILAAFEYDGGDARAPKQWGDLFVDLVPAAPNVAVTPMSLGTAVAAPTAVPSSISRARIPVSVGGIVVSDFMGVLITWTENFPTQTVPTKLNSWQPSFDIQPAAEIGWTTFSSSFGLQGYGHIRQIAIAWVSTTPITLTITTTDGQSPAPITIPSSGGQYLKQMFPLTANKGQLFKVSVTSSAPFQIFEDDCEVHVGQWGREGSYAVVKNFGGVQDAQAAI